MLQNLVRQDHLKRTHSHRQPHTHMYSVHKSTTLTQTDHKERPLCRRKNSSARGKAWWVCCFLKRNVLRLDLEESREGVCRKGKGRSFHLEGLKTEKAQDPTSGIKLTSA